MEVLPLERPLLELSNRIAELKTTARNAVVGGQKRHDAEISQELKILEGQFEILATQIFSNLSPYEVVQLSRHPHRPYTLDVVDQLCTDFVELQGDRNFMEDASVVGGLAVFRSRRVMVLGHQKGRGTKENLKRNFGMPRPEGYRKALRLMTMAERFGLPVITFIDTPGAYPGIDAEERGQSEAIAKNIMVMSRLRIPIISVIMGEGGSGGALAIGVGNRILMMQYSTYSVISPEGCASILWKDGSQADRAASAMRVTSQSALDLGVADEVVPEPLGGAHWHPKEAIETLGHALERNLKDLEDLSGEELSLHRVRKFAQMGTFRTRVAEATAGMPPPQVAAWNETWEDVQAALAQDQGALN